MLTHKDTFLPKSEVQRIAASIIDIGEGKGHQRRIRLPPPAIIRPKELWTGKQVLYTETEKNSLFVIVDSTDDCTIC